MKRVLKGAEPQTLIFYRTANPDTTWSEMRHDALHQGQEASKDCRAQSLADQYGLCAYCECKFDPKQPHKFSVEHVYPKSGTTAAGPNWHLDWNNLLAVCDGGKSQGSPSEPLPDNLSCDAAKGNKSINVSPLAIPAFPNLFELDKGTGHLKPNPASCARASIDAAELQATLDALNLNCERLARQRRQLVINIDKNKKVLRLKNYGPQNMSDLLIERYFSTQWPEFFTTIRCCLGQIAENHLSSVGYTG